MDIVVDAASPTPPFDQVRLRLIALIERGDLPPGTRLPSVRALAADLDLAPNTVARAYKELEAAHFVQTRGRAGTVVSAGPDTATARAVEAARQFARQMQHLGVDETQALDLVRAALGDGR